MSALLSAADGVNSAGVPAEGPVRDMPLLAQGVIASNETMTFISIHGSGLTFAAMSGVRVI